MNTALKLLAQLPFNLVSWTHSMPAFLLWIMSFNTHTTHFPTLLPPTVVQFSSAPFKWTQQMAVIVNLVSRQSLLRQDPSYLDMRTMTSQWMEFQICCCSHNKLRAGPFTLADTYHLAWVKKDYSFITPGIIHSLRFLVWHCIWLQDWVPTIRGEHSCFHLIVFLDQSTLSIFRSFTHSWYGTLFAQCVFHLHGIFWDIVSDHGPQFILHPPSGIDKSLFRLPSTVKRSRWTNPWRMNSDPQIPWLGAHTCHGWSTHRIYTAAGGSLWLISLFPVASKPNFIFTVGLFFAAFVGLYLPCPERRFFFDYFFLESY